MHMPTHACVQKCVLMSTGMAARLRMSMYTSARRYKRLDSQLRTVFTRVSVHACAYVCACARARVRAHVEFVRACVCVRARAYMCVCARARVCLCVCARTPR